MATAMGSTHRKELNPAGNPAQPRPHAPQTAAALLDSMTDRQERKRIRRILRQALEGPLPIPQDPSKATARAPAEPRPSQAAADLDPALLERLLGEGLLARSGTGLVATPQTASFLRRALCDLPDEAFADQHRQIEPATLILPEGRQSVRRNLKESPLYPLLRLKEKDGAPFLPETAVQAGDRLAGDFDYGGLQPRITASWQPRLSTRVKGAAPQGPDLADSQLAARARVNRAVEALGPELAGVALDVCCFGKGLETVERERQWPARSAKLMLRAALLALARHYAPPAPNARPRHWGETGYRPEFG